MDGTPEEGARTLSPELIHGFNGFGLGLYGRLPADRNLFFSPLSISLVLSTLVPGARGSTTRALEGVLGFEGLEATPGDAVADVLSSLTRRTAPDWEEDPETGEWSEVEREVFILHLANALFAQQGYPILHEYVSVLRESFGADLFSVDFARAEEAAGRINDWVSDQTRRKITNLVSPDLLVPLTRLVLANAVYFKAEWAAQFDSHWTEPWPFHRLGEAGAVDVDMMRQVISLGHWSDPELGVAAVEIPYRAMSMLVLLPDEGRLAAVDAALGHGLLDRAASHLSPTRLELRLPKFRMKTSLELKDILKESGLGIAFDEERADFGGISEHEDGLVLSDVIHQARIEVDEEGTEAAAATLAAMMASGIPEPEPDPIPFTVDRPFVFFIRDQVSGAVLFMGRVTDPG